MAIYFIQPIDGEPEVHACHVNRANEFDSTLLDETVFRADFLVFSNRSLDFRRLVSARGRLSAKQSFRTLVFHYETVIKTVDRTLTITQKRGRSAF